MGIPVSGDTPPGVVVALTPGGNELGAPVRLGSVAGMPAVSTMLRLAALVLVGEPVLAAALAPLVMELEPAFALALGAVFGALEPGADVGPDAPAVLPLAPPALEPEPPVPPLPAD